jgi:hypothetical protein
MLRQGVCVFSSIVYVFGLSFLFWWIAIDLVWADLALGSKSPLIVIACRH